MLSASTKILLTDLNQTGGGIGLIVAQQDHLFQDHLKHLAKSGLFQRGVELGQGIYIYLHGKMKVQFLEKAVSNMLLARGSFTRKYKGKSL